MNKYGFILLFLGLSCHAVQAESTAPPTISLFFTPGQTREAENLARKNAPAGSADIHLGAVFYYAPDDWVLWLQGQKWTPQTQRDDLRVIDVSPDEVHLIWRDETNEPQHITLRPNQTYQMATKSIAP